MAKKDTLILDLLGLASVVGFGFAVYQLYKLTRGDKKSEELSSADGLKTMTYTLTNNTDKTQVEYLFDSRSGQNNPNVGISPSIDFFNNELSNKPKRLIKVEFRNVGGSNFSNVTAIPSDGMGGITSGEIGTYTPVSVGTPTPPTPPIVDPSAPPSGSTVTTTPSPNQAEAPFKMTCKDASGDSSTKQYTPLISSQQYQGGITSVDFRGTILDGECYMQYTMFPNSKVAIVLYYEDIDKADLLKKKDKTEEVKNTSSMKKTNIPTENNSPLKMVGTVAVVGAVGYLGYKMIKK
jgi:hypothetical protein